VRIAIDIDSTLHHYWDQLAEVAQRRHGVALPYEEQHTWGITALEPEQLRECVLETHTETYVLAGEPYPGAVETVRAWKEAGHFIHITSHRATDAHEATERWLHQIGLPFDELYCSYDKISRCVEIGIHVLVDDSPVNLHRAVEAGMTGATISHPWNRALCREKDIVCAPDWASLARELDRILQAVSR
jgi:FMN phosphatase YigB (HAD superfamily)